nr:uncharacterized protein LOC109173071 [Ipomoea batatas]
MRTTARNRQTPEQIRIGKTEVNPPEVSSSNAGQSKPEKYRAWMLVSRKDKRGRFKRPTQYAHEPATERRQVAQGINTSLVGEWATQSRFAALNGLGDNGMD